MSDAELVADLAQPEVDRNIRHNYVVNFLDGTAFWFGSSFIASATILPVFISRFTENKLVIGMIAVISSAGYFLPQLFTSNWTQQQPVKRDVVVRVGFFTERLPLLLFPLAPLSALISPILPVVLLLCFYAWHCFGAGTIAVAWQDMLGKVIPLKTRARFFGITSFGGTFTGILGASVAAYLLDHINFPYGYAISFTIAGLMVLLSWVFIAMTREKPVFNSEPVVSQLEYWKKLPAIVKVDKNFRNFLLTMIVSYFGGMAWGFVAVYSKEQWGLSDGQVGAFTIWLLIGQSAGNLLAGWAADRFGHRLVLLCSLIVSATSLAFALIAPTPAWFSIVFVLRGVSVGGFMVASLIILEFSQSAMRPTYIGIYNTALGFVGLLTPLLGGWLYQVAGHRWLFSLSLSIGIVAFLMLAVLVREPRQDGLLKNVRAL